MKREVTRVTESQVQRTLPLGKKPEKRGKVVMRVVIRIIGRSHSFQFHYKFRIQISPEFV